mmetsp:Transcript_48788/g.136559  ORF Transcript_48788/g.136559 Transcript_48788/m.136559 type:complete len:311 (+) Transcript_48788:87-1019(+)
MLRLPVLFVSPLVLCGHTYILAEAAIAVLSGSERHASGHQDASSLSSRRIGSGSAVVAKEQPSCSCDCCDVVERRPDEIVDNVGVKCSPSEEHSEDVCGEQCAPAPGDQVLASNAEDAAVDYQRFCFFECKPAEGVASPVRTQCVALDEVDVRRVMDSTGNAMDPAPVYGRALRRGNSVRATPAAALLGATRGKSSRAIALDATREATEGRRTTEAEALEASRGARRTRGALDDIRGAGGDVYAGIGELRGNVDLSRARAEAAEKAARTAEAMLQEAQLANGRIATKVAEEQLAAYENQVLATTPLPRPT